MVRDPAPEAPAMSCLGSDCQGSAAFASGGMDS
jgi:hypothetical protein